MKNTAFAIGMVSGVALGAVASVITENYISPKMRRDIKRKTNQGLHAMEHIIGGINDLMHD